MFKINDIFEPQYLHCLTIVKPFFDFVNQIKSNLIKKYIITEVNTIPNDDKLNM